MNWWYKLFNKRKEPNYSRCHACNSIAIKGKDLVFIGRINSIGTHVENLYGTDMSNLDDRTFSLNCLSITFGTYIACEFNSYIVKLKK